MIKSQFDQRIKNTDKSKNYVRIIFNTKQREYHHIKIHEDEWIQIVAALS